MKRIGESVECGGGRPKKLFTEYSLFNASDELDLLEFTRCLELALASEDVKLQRLALGAVCSACQHVGIMFSRIAYVVVRLVMEAEQVPQLWRWEALLSLNRQIGISSSVYTCFDGLVKSASDYLQDDEKNIPQALVDLILSVISTSLAMLSPRMLCEFQRVVCSKALLWQPDVRVLQLLDGLLRHNHAEVPSPIQVATTIFNHCMYTKNSLYEKIVNEARQTIEICTRSKIPPVCSSYTRATSSNEIGEVESSSTSNVEADVDAEECINLEVALSSFYSQ